MPDDLSSHLGLPWLLPGQAQKHVTHNEALRLLDVVVQLAVLRRDLSAPPALAQEGDRHIVGPGAGGDWAGQEGRIAFLDQGVWGFAVPRAGWRAHVLSEGATLVHDGTHWAEGPARLGINTAPDATNRLAVAAEATLLTHAGAGHRLKLNKAAAADTASLLFQTGWSGRAEMGTAGSDSFALKVSADGASWATALSADPATGRIEAPAGLTVGGAPVVHRGALLGTVGQAGGAPTGAVIERGSNANGDYVRFADGTQICTKRWTGLGPVNTAQGAGHVSAATTIGAFAAAFADVPFVSARAAAQGSGETVWIAFAFAQAPGAYVPANNGSFRIASFAASALATFQVAMTAVGRWF